MRGPQSPCRCYAVDDLRALELNACLEIEYNTFYTVALTDADELNGASVEVGSGWGVCTLVRDGVARVYELDEAEAFARETLLRYHADDTALVCRSPSSPSAFECHRLHDPAIAPRPRGGVCLASRECGRY